MKSVIVAVALFLVAVASFAFAGESAHLQGPLQAPAKAEFGCSGAAEFGCSGAARGERRGLFGRRARVGTRRAALGGC